MHEPPTPTPTPRAFASPREKFATRSCPAASSVRGAEAAEAAPAEDEGCAGHYGECDGVRLRCQPRSAACDLHDSARKDRRTTEPRLSVASSLSELNRMDAIFALDEQIDDWGEDDSLLDSTSLSIDEEVASNTIKAEVEVHRTAEEDSTITHVKKDSVLFERKGRSNGNINMARDDTIDVIGTSPSRRLPSACPLWSKSAINCHKDLNMSLERERVLERKMRSILGQLRKRALDVRRQLETAPALSDCPVDDDSAFDGRISFRNHFVLEDFDASLRNTTACATDVTSACSRDAVRGRGFVDPRGRLNLVWLSVQAAIFLYNAWVIPLRFVFPGVQSDSNVIAWLCFDYLSDLLLLIDVALFKPRLLYIEDGLWVRDWRKLLRHYVDQGHFRTDVFSLLPSDLLYFWLGLRYTVVRLPRLWRIYDFWEFIYRLDAILARPHILRIVKTISYMFYLIHLNACAYYAFSDWAGLGSDPFLYDGHGNAYIRCFHFATRTVTSIGQKNRKPTNNAEFLFMTVLWLMGVFVFAILIGDIRDIVISARSHTQAFERKMDAILAYLSKHRVHKSIVSRVRTWMAYTWQQHQSLNEAKLLHFLPLKMRTDIAMRVHYPTLVKVKLFRHCDPGLLKDLSILLRPLVYLPEEFICRKNDIGNEMFIVQSGRVRVLGGLDGRTVLCHLAEGSVFGEIALLGVGGMNKRTADVISVGFTTLYVLRKCDLEEVLKDYPDAKRILNARAQKLIRENEDRLRKEKHLRPATSDSDIGGRSDVAVALPVADCARKEPALLRTVMQVLQTNSTAMHMFARKPRAPLTPLTPLTPQ